jgi:hypothetical protein
MCVGDDVSYGLLRYFEEGIEFCSRQGRVQVGDSHAVSMARRRPRWEGAKGGKKLKLYHYLLDRWPWYWPVLGLSGRI